MKIKELSVADYITLLATFLIINSFWILWSGRVTLAISVAFVSMFFDYLDGYLARKHGGSDYGKVLDSLYDVLGWVLFPALVVNIQSGWAWWAIIVTTAYCLSSFIRLAHFTVNGYVEKKKRYYNGVPVLFSKYALLLVLILDAKLSVLILLIMTPLMLSSRLVKKPPNLLAQLNLLYAFIFLLIYLR